MNKKPKKAHTIDNSRDSRPNSVNYYLHFTKASQKAGSIATESFFQLRDFLTRDINLPSKKDFADVISGIIPKLDNTAKQKQGEPRARKKEELDEIIKRSNEVLAEASTVFPFTLFPDTVTVERSKLIITQRTFFFTSRTLTIHIEDVLNVGGNVGPFFGALRIAIRGLTSEDHFVINFFWRRDAIHLKHMLQGHIMAQHDNIDYRHLEKDKLIKALLRLGQDSDREKID